ncbi:hypothetical protein NQ315_009809 [Exocentrus adspersus]|uniref:ABC transporter domain-containing protein n=1 Tax=Exocentrus adspersus TaxID=1586481 RepID=A0AAV8WI64_9CUCU|nr:hypothetical protein NQ315_009809 [Exocentrus adspersus]
MKMKSQLVLVEREDKVRNAVVGSSGLLLNDKYIITTTNIHFDAVSTLDVEELEPGQLYTSFPRSATASFMIVSKDGELYDVKKARMLATFTSGNIKYSNKDIFQNWAIDSKDNNWDLNTAMSLFLVLAVGENAADVEDFKNILKQWWDLTMKLEANKGDAVYCVSTPFGNRNFINSLSKGIVSNILGNSSCLLVSDCPCAPGCEGSPVYLSLSGSSDEVPVPFGIVLSSLSWWRGEWIGLTLIADIRPIILELTDVPVRMFDMGPRIERHALIATIECCLAQIYCGRSWGTAILLDDNKGIFLTNAHVTGSERLTLFHKGQSYNAQLVYRTPEGAVFDLAVVKCDPKLIKNRKNMKSISISSKKIAPGDTVYSAGYSLFPRECHPSPTLSKGCISHVDASMIKTTCCVHPGSSGGAILDPDGRLVGVIVCNSRLEHNRTVYPRVNMAVPFSAVLEPVFGFIERGDEAVLNDLHVRGKEAEYVWKRIEGKLGFQFCDIELEYKMIFTQLKVVVWKNFIIRKRHWLLTIIESILPILLFLLIAYGRSKISGLNKVEVTEVTYNEPHGIPYRDLDVDQTMLYYTPDTEFYEDLMKRVQVKFQMYNNNIKGFATPEALLQYYASHHNNTVVAVIFKGTDRKNLDYTIRVHEEYDSGSINTAELYTSSILFTPGIGTPYFYKGYLAIQKAIDLSFIEKSLGRDLEDNVTLLMQEFPYPPHKEDSALSTMFLIYLPVITLFSFIFICPAVLKRVVEEKYSGTKELMKMVGMKSWMLWLGWFIYGMLPMLLSVFCIVLLMKIPFFGTEYPPIENTDGSVLFVFLLLYCMAAMVFCFAISSFFNKPTIAMVAGILIWILSYFVPKYGLGLEEMGTKLSWPINMLLNLFPNMALHYGYLTVSLYEQRELGIQWNNMYKSSSGGTDDVTMLNVLVMLLVDIVLYMSFTLYMDGVNPGKYGVRKSFLFPIYSLIKLMKRSSTIEDHQGMEPLRLDHVEEGRGLKKGIEIRDLVKRYGHKVAVNHLSLNVYHDQITVLLGHNGAGKSTTMSMITGMLDVTSGVIKMNGRNIRSNMDEVRKTLGLCPQHNLLFTDLTVGEHLLFFAKLKGRTSKEAETEMKELLQKLHLTEKKNAMACTLSGGMKRKLCLGMAIIGGSKILILDEPTSGMDPESRRELWDLLLAWRGEKTILITTHFMEEADALGDWIAIMAYGKLLCHGTPMYLKNQYETGYHLSLIVKDDATASERNTIGRSIKEHLDTAQLKDCNGNNMVFVLPLEDNSKIAALLSYLEDNKEDLKIENVSVAVTTLEDVFLKVKMENDTDSKMDKLDTQDKHSTTSSDSQLFLMRIFALIVKKMQFYKKKMWTYLIPTLIALIFFILTIYLSGNTTGHRGDNGPEVKLQLSTYKRTTAFYNGSPSNQMKRAYKSLIESNMGVPLDVQDVQQEIVNKGIENIVYYKEHIIVSAEFATAATIQATALYNPVAIHSAPISLNLITSALAKAHLGDEYSITTSNWPLETINAYTSQEYSEDKVRLLWSILMPIGFLLVIGSFIVFPHIELSTNFAQLQYMCGVKPQSYWLVNYFMDVLVYVVICVFMAVVGVAMAPYIACKEYFILLLIFTVYGLANIPFVYLFSRKKSVSSGFAVFVITGIFFGIILTISVQVLLESQDDYYMALGHGLKVLFILVLPQVGLAHCVMTFCKKAVQNYNMDVMSRAKRLSVCMSNPNPCCVGKTPECVMYERYLPLLEEDLLLMLASCVIYIILNILLDTYRVKKCCAKVQLFVSKIWYKYSDYENLNTSDNEPKYNSLRAKKLQKTYSGKPIVKNIDFTLKEKECLGILGVNGAGKTTTFRMLTREEVVDNGDVEIINKNSNRIAISQDEYLENLGYCPQIDALNFVLTGRQILTVISKLRGVDNPEVVDTFLKVFELEQYADMPCGYYSGGNKRKLSLAVALIGCPKFVLLDEPTNGVDPSTRRKFWNLIRSFKETNDQSFILTSHSMVECEALCNNLKIMKDGKFEKEGTISDLKKEHGGFNVKLKLVNKGANKDVKTSSGSDPEEGYDEVDGYRVVKRFSDVEELKEYFANEYQGTVKDEHCGLLHIYVADKSKRWGEMFKEVERIKSNNPHLIEDYAISEASLEDIFLTVARSSGVDEQKKPKKSKKLRGGRQTV